MKKSLLFFRFLKAILLIWGVWPSGFCYGFTSVQTSTSIGMYRSYSQNNRFPIFHSWSVQGMYAERFLTDFQFYLNNDFSTNQWKASLAEGKIEILSPLFLGRENAFDTKLILGRQFYIDGFDLFLLDGVQMPLNWSAVGGISVQTGLANSLDFEIEESSNMIFSGLSFWEEIHDWKLRAGYTGRGENMQLRHGFISLGRLFPNTWLAPSIFTKQEWDLVNQRFNQSITETTFELSPKTSGRIHYSYLNPRPVEQKNQANFIYRIMALSPTESAGGDLSYQLSQDRQFAFSVQTFSYLANLRQENAEQQDFSMQLNFNESTSATGSLTNLRSYSGSLQDMGIALTYALSDRQQIILEVDVGYLSKINNIKGFVSHVRSQFESTLGKSAKGILAIEAERNQYFEFDSRIVAYVTSYL